MLFRGRPPDLELHLKINNAEIPKVTGTKFLGIVIDDRLNWKPHIQSVKSKLSCLLCIKHLNWLPLLECTLCIVPYFNRICHTAMKYGVIIMLQMSNVCASFKGKL